MDTKRVRLFVSVFVLACALPLFLSGREASSDAENQLLSTGRGSVESLEIAYTAWEETYVKAGGDRNLVIAMGWFKGLSTGETAAHGRAQINLVEGLVSVEVNGLAKNEAWDFWLVDNGRGSIITPDAEDAMVRVGSLQHGSKAAKLEANLGSEAFGTFDPDLFIVTHAGKSPIEDRVIVGTTTLFHRLYRSNQSPHLGVLADLDLPTPRKEERSIFSRMIDAISPTAEAQIGPIPNPTTTSQLLITQGRNLFNNEQFNGNGRTCATCHREDQNLTIDPEFIATLPPSDALFVAEFTPALAVNFEKPVLMRNVGLILENADGFSNLATRFVMRGVPHALALLQNTLTPAAGGAADGSTVPPNERTGWGGDGAPGTGTLREFATGAVTQHFTKRLNRVPGVDFRLPTSGELDAMEAFQRSTGRRVDLVLTGPGALSLKNASARRGQLIFTNPSATIAAIAQSIGINVVNNPAIGAGNCFVCHLNAGASDLLAPGQNLNFNTNVEQLPSQPADLLVPPSQNPPDGGFGQGPPPALVQGIGNGSFNTPVVVESADTGPFFHNNSIGTIEGAVDFYNSAAFNQPPGFGSLVGGINLQPTEVEAVALFLRVINALENIRSSIEIEQRAKNATSFSQAQELLKLSIADLEDAREVLDCAGIHPSVQHKLLEAAGFDALALITPLESLRDFFIDQAIALKISARGELRN